MDTLDELTGLYNSYIKEITDILKHKKFFDGCFGLGDDPAKKPCHEIFFKSTESLLASYSSNPENKDSQETHEIIRYILESPLSYGDRDCCYWMLFAAISHIEILLPLIGKEEALYIKEFFDKNIPPQGRMPKHDRLYKKLKKLL